MLLSRPLFFQPSAEPPAVPRQTPQFESQTPLALDTYRNNRGVNPTPFLLLFPSIRPSVRSSIRSFIHPFVRSEVRASVRSFVPPFVRPSVRSFVPKFVRSEVRSFNSSDALSVSDCVGQWSVNQRIDMSVTCTILEYSTMLCSVNLSTKERSVAPLEGLCPRTSTRPFSSLLMLCHTCRCHRNPPPRRSDVKNVSCVRVCVCVCVCVLASC